VKRIIISAAAVAVVVVVVVNRIQAIRVLEVRTTVFFTSKIHSIKRLKRILFSESTEVGL
jgi:hypothetical protein